MESTEISGRQAVWRDSRALALLMAAMLTTMANATISPALPELERLFADDPGAAMLTRLLVPAPSLSVALLAPFAGLIADRFGRRPLLLSGLVLFVLAGCAGLFLPDLRTIFVSRLALGIAVALIMTAQTALVGDYFTGEDRGALAGLQISARNLGGFVFISLAGWAACVSPRLPFAIYGLAGALLPSMWKVVAEPRRAARMPGSAAAKDGAGHPAWRLAFAALVVLQAATNMLFFLMPTQLPFFFDARGDDSAVMTGTALGILMLSGGGLALLYVRLQRAVGYAMVFALGYAAMAIGFLLLILPSTASFALAGPFAGTAMIGAGYATVSPTFIALALHLAPAGRRGMAGGALTASVFVGQFLSPLFATPAIPVVGYDGLFGATAILLAAMAIAASIAGRASRRRQAAPALHR